VEHFGKKSKAQGHRQIYQIFNSHNAYLMNFTKLMHTEG